MLVSLFLPFLDIFSPSMSSLGCKVLCIVINYLVLRPICWSSSLDHSTNGPEYLTKGTAQVFIPLMKFLLQSVGFKKFSCSFQVLFSYFSFFSAGLMARARAGGSYLVSPSTLILICYFCSFRYLSFSVSHY